MALLVTTMIDIAAAGGGLDIDCAAYAMVGQSMRDIASAAAGSKRSPKIIFRNTSLLGKDMVEVAALGQGCVVFAGTAEKA